MKKKLVYIFIGAFLFRFLLSFVTSHPDVNNHVDWGIRFFEYGFDKFYSANVWNFTWPNQPPGTIYLFAGVRKLFEAVFAFFWFININIQLFPSGIITFFESNLYPALLKLPSILADVGISYLIYKYFKEKGKKKLARLGAIFFLINPVIWYNSALWGQTDAVINFLMLLSFMLLFKKRFTLSLLSLVLSIYIKASLLIFLPVYFVVALTSEFDLKDWLKAGAVSYLVVALITYPFSNGEPLSYLFKLYKDKIFLQQLHVITANAFNLWAGITGIHERPDTQMLGPLTYKAWGLVLYGLAYIPALYAVYKRKREMTVFWALSVVAFSTFMLLTNMHERYLYPFFPVFTIVAVSEGLTSVYWAVSGINLINLYHLWFTPRIEAVIDVLSWRDRFVPKLLGFVNFGVFIYFYKKFLRLFPRSKL